MWVLTQLIEPLNSQKGNYYDGEKDEKRGFLGGWRWGGGSCEIQMGRQERQTTTCVWAGGVGPKVTLCQIERVSNSQFFDSNWTSTASIFNFIDWLSDCRRILVPFSFLTKKFLDFRFFLCLWLRKSWWQWLILLFVTINTTTCLCVYY